MTAPDPGRSYRSVRSGRSRRALFAGAVGNVIEWYEFGVLDAELADVPLRLSDESGLPADAKEAYAFAVPGFLTVHGLPGTAPRSTGARHPSVLGSVTPGRRGLPRPGRHIGSGFPSPWGHSDPSRAARPPVRLVIE